jgi:hypothetical protein
MSDKKVPTFTTGNIGKPSVTYVPQVQDVYVNAWNGQILNSHPTFSTPTGLPSGHKNQFFHGGVKLENSNTIMFHGIGNMHR